MLPKRFKVMKDIYIKHGELLNLIIIPAGTVIELMEVEEEHQDEEFVHVFIVEDEQVAQRMLDEHFKKSRAITCAYVVPKEHREKLIDKIDEVGSL